jgi:hypothetical protein
MSETVERWGRVFRRRDWKDWVTTIAYCSLASFVVLGMVAGIYFSNPPAFEDGPSYVLVQGGEASGSVRTVMGTVFVQESLFHGGFHSTGEDTRVLVDELTYRELSPGNVIEVDPRTGEFKGRVYQSIEPFLTDHDASTLLHLSMFFVLFILVSVFCFLYFLFREELVMLSVNGIMSIDTTGLLRERRAHVRGRVFPDRTGGPDAGPAIFRVSDASVVARLSEIVEEQRIHGVTSSSLLDCLDFIVFRGDVRRGGMPSTVKTEAFDVLRQRRDGGTPG